MTVSAASSDYCLPRYLAQNYFGCVLDVHKYLFVFIKHLVVVIDRLHQLSINRNDGDGLS